MTRDFLDKIGKLKNKMSEVAQAPKKTTIKKPKASVESTEKAVAEKVGASAPVAEAPKVSSAKTSAPKVAKAPKVEAKVADAPAESAPVESAPAEGKQKGSKTTATNIDNIIRVLITKFNLDEKLVKNELAQYLPSSSVYRKTKKARDVDAPKKALSSYMYFTMENRDAVKNSDANMTFQGITKELGRRWSSMTEADKKPYVDKANADKARHDEEDVKYRTGKGLPPRVVKKEKATESS